MEGVSWVDRSKSKPKTVNLLTSLFNQEEAIRIKLGEVGKPDLPHVVADYRKNKSLGDIANAFIRVYSFDHRQRKWTKAAITFLFHLCIHNAHILSDGHLGIKTALLDFERV